MSAESEIAGRVLEAVRATAGAGTEADVFVSHCALALTRFANSYIHQNVADATTTVRLRVHVDGRTAAGSTTRTSADGLADLVDRAVAAAAKCPPDRGWPGLAPPAPLAGSGNWDEATAQAGPDERAARVQEFVAAAGGLETAGFCRTMHWAAAFADSAGQSVAARTSEAAIDAVARVAGSDGVARHASNRLADLDAAALGAHAAAKARAGRDPAELPPGRYEVVLEPTAVSDVLANLAGYGFSGKAYVERRSFAEPGVRQFDPSVTLVDDALRPAGPGLPFDGDGTPKQRLALVESGLTRAVVYDRRTAAEAGAVPTGHAPDDGWIAPRPTNLGLAPAAGSAEDGPGEVLDAATAALVARVQRGLLVADLWYTRVLDPRTLAVTGLTRNGVWLIERGEVTSAVRNLRFTQSYPRALAPGAVLGIGSSATTLPTSWGRAWWTAPALHLADWNFTGGASG